MRHFLLFTMFLSCIQVGIAKEPSTLPRVKYIHQLNYDQSISLGIGFSDTLTNASVILMNDRGFFAEKDLHHGEAVFDHLVEGPHYEFYLSYDGTCIFLERKPHYHDQGLLICRSTHKYIESYISYWHAERFYDYLLRGVHLSSFEKKYIIQELYHAGKLPETYRHSFPMDPPSLSDTWSHRCGLITSLENESNDVNITESHITPVLRKDEERLAKGSSKWTSIVSNKLASLRSQFVFEKNDSSEAFQREPSFQQSLLELTYTWLCLDETDRLSDVSETKNLDLQYLLGAELTSDLAAENASQILPACAQSELYYGFLVYQNKSKNPIEYLDFAEVHCEAKDQGDTTSSEPRSMDQIINKIFGKGDLGVIGLLKTEGVKLEVERRMNELRNTEVLHLPPGNKHVIDFDLIHNQLRFELGANETKNAVLFCAHKMGTTGESKAKGSLNLATHFQVVSSVPRLVNGTTSTIEMDTEEILLFQASYQPDQTLDDLSHAAYNFIRKSRGESVGIGVQEMQRISRTYRSGIKEEDVQSVRSDPWEKSIKNEVQADHLGRISHTYTQTDILQNIRMIRSRP